MTKQKQNKNEVIEEFKQVKITLKLKRQVWLKELVRLLKLMVKMSCYVEVVILPFQITYKMNLKSQIEEQ